MGDALLCWECEMPLQDCECDEEALCCTQCDEPYEDCEYPVCDDCGEFEHCCLCSS